MRASLAAAAVQAPRFEVDPLWPKPLPNKWILGQTIGVSVDAEDHVWIIHRAGSLEPGEVHATTTPPTAQRVSASAGSPRHHRDAARPAQASRQNPANCRSVLSGGLQGMSDHCIGVSQSG